LSSRLQDAVASGDVNEARRLIKLGARANFRNARGETPLSFAAAWNQLDSAKLLLEGSADPNLADRHGGTPLMLAAQHGSPELVRVLLNAGADPRAQDKAGNSVLAHTTWREHRDGVKEIILRALDGQDSHAK
jgi:ankyrin repeat protein